MFSVNTSFLLGADLFEGEGGDDGSSDDDDRSTFDIPSQLGRNAFVAIESSSASSGAPPLLSSPPSPALSPTASAQQQEKQQQQQQQFLLGALTDIPPLLEASGWHPLSGTPAERSEALKRFNLEQLHNTCSAVDRTRWYQGQSPWRAALVPPNGGVAFGVPYGTTPVRAAACAKWKLGDNVVEIKDAAAGSTGRSAMTAKSRGMNYLAK
jgi:hypothetical protein